MRNLLPVLLLAAAPLWAAPVSGPSAPAPSDAAALQDPMRPPAFALRKYRQEKLRQQTQGGAAGKPAVKPEPLVLNSILFSSSRRRAIVNGRLLALGERIDGARLVAIERDRVRLTRKGKTLVLKLGSASLDLKKTRTR